MSWTRAKTRLVQKGIRFSDPVNMTADRGGQNQPQTDSYDRFTTESTIGIVSVVTTIGQFSVVNLW